MDKFVALAGFIAVVENGGFAPAARRMGVAPSSLTRQMNALEETLGTPLLNRSTRRTTLTEAGAHYFEDAKRILAELDDADRAINERGGPPSGLLRVTLPVAFGRLHVAPAIPAFLRLYPGIRLDIRLTDSVVNLVEDRIDVAIRLGALASSSLISRKLAPHCRVICASRSYLEEHGPPSTPQDLAGHNCLLFDYLSGGDVWTLTRGEDREKIAVSGNLRATGSEFLREAAIGGAGLVLMPTWLVGEDIASGRLQPVLEQWSPAPTDDQGAVWAVYQPNRRGTKTLAALLDFLSGHFGTPPYWDRFSVDTGRPG